MNPAAGDLFPGSLWMSILGAVWVWLLALHLGATLLPAKRRETGGGTILPWLVLGIAVQAQVWLLVSFTGRLWPPLVLGIAATLTVVTGLASGSRVLQAIGGPPLDVGGEGDPTWIGKASWLVLIPFFLIVARFAIWPTVFYDDLVYHLGVPRQALLTGTWPAMQGMHYSFMPAGWDAAYVLPLALGGGSGPQLMNLVTLALFAWAACRLCLLGGSAAAAIAATTLLVVAPMTGALGAFAGNDLFVALALCVALERLLASRGERPIVVGLLAGAAWAAKYSALPACAAIALAAAISRKAGWGRRFATASLVGGVTVLTAAAWTARSWIMTGNPIYPAFYGTLGGRFWSAESAASVAGQVSHGGVGDRGPAAFVQALPDLLFHSDTLGNPSGINSIFLVLALVGFLRWRRVRHAPVLLVVAVITYIGWCMTSLNLRYALFLLVVLAPFATATIQIALNRCGRLSSVPIRRMVLPAALVLAVAGPSVELVRRHLKQYAAEAMFGGTPRADMHVTRLNLAAAARAMVDDLPDDARILLVGEGRIGLLPRPALASSAYDTSDLARLTREVDSVDELNGRLKDFSHVVVNFRELERFRKDYGYSDRFRPRDWELFQGWLAGGLETVGEFGNVVVYRIPAERDS